MKNKVILAALIATGVIGCNKTVECHTCENGHPIGNLFNKECKEPWIPMSDVNPCVEVYYENKIDSLQQEIMDIGWKNDSLVLKYEHGWEFTN